MGIVCVLAGSRWQDHAHTHSSSSTDVIITCIERTNQSCFQAFYTWFVKNRSIITSWLTIAAHLLLLEYKLIVFVIDVLLCEKWLRDWSNMCVQYSQECIIGWKQSCSLRMLSIRLRKNGQMREGLKTHTQSFLRVENHLNVNERRRKACRSQLSLS